MGLIISTTDFNKGRCKIGVNNAILPDLEKYILDYEEYYLAQLLGYDLFVLFKADVDSVTKLPVTQIYLDIYNQIKSDDLNSCGPVYSIGLKETIMRFVYFHYMRDMCYQPTLSGASKNNTEVSRNVNFDESNIYSRWNEGVMGVEAIQEYIRRDDTESYPDYKGKRFGLTHWSL